MKRHTTSQVAAALKASGGIVSNAAKVLGIHRHTLECRIESEPALREVHFEVTEAVLDVAEGTIIKGVNEGDSTLTCYFLNKRGASRGYGSSKKVEINRAEFPFSAIERVTVAATIEPSPPDRALMLAAERSAAPVGQSENAVAPIPRETLIEEAPVLRIAESAPRIDPAPQIERIAPRPREPAPVIGYAERLKRCL